MENHSEPRFSSDVFFRERPDGLFVEVRPARERVFAIVVHGHYAVSDNFFFFEFFKLFERNGTKLIAIERGILVFFIIFERKGHVSDGEGIISDYDIQKLFRDKYFHERGEFVATGTKIPHSGQDAKSCIRSNRRHRDGHEKARRTPGFSNDLERITRGSFR